MCMCVWRIPQTWSTRLIVLCQGFMILMWFVIGDVEVDGLDKVMSARFLYCKVIILQYPCSFWSELLSQSTLRQRGFRSTSWREECQKNSWCMLMGCAHSCPTLCDPMDWDPSGSSVHGISQVRILEWVAISFSRESSWHRDQTCVSCVSCICRCILYH